MSGLYDDMPSLVDSFSSGNQYPSSPYIPPPQPSSQYPQFPGTRYRDEYPRTPYVGGSSLWSGTGWGDTPSQNYAGYPNLNNRPIESTPIWSSAQSTAWNPAVYRPPARWGYPSSDVWSTPSSYNASPITATPGAYPSQSFYSTPLLGGQTASLQNQIQPFYHNTASTSSPYSIPRPSSENGYDRLTLARRPRDWRRDYKVRSGISSILPRRQRSLSTSAERVPFDETRRDLHKFLQYNLIAPVSLDLRNDPMSVRFHHLNRPFNQYDLLQFACDPPVNSMRLYHDKLPWYIDIQARNPSGVTIYDLFDQMHDSLMEPIRDKHYYTDEMDDEDRAKIAWAFKERCGNNQNEISKGIRKIDYLRGRVIFEGLTRGKNGMWEIKLKKRQVASP